MRKLILIFFIIIIAPYRTPVANSSSGIDQKIVDFDIDKQIITSVHTTQSTNIEFAPGVIPSSNNLTSLRQIIGPDDRTRVMNTSTYPWSTVAQVEYVNQNNTTSICTGWMLGASTIVTNGHCVYLLTPSGGSAGWGRSYRIRPGRNGANIPWECSGFYAHVPQAWIEAVNRGEGTLSTSRRHDWAGIDMRCRVGETTGVLGFRSTNDTDLGGQLISATGYPGIPPDPNVGQGITMWTGPGNIVAADFRPGVIDHTSDTTSGQSGGPIWQTENVPSGCSNPCVVGVHAAEVQDGGVTPNVGVRITPAVFDELLAWRQYKYPMVYIPLIKK